MTPNRGRLLLASMDIAGDERDVDNSIIVALGELATTPDDSLTPDPNPKL